MPEQFDEIFTLRRACLSLIGKGYVMVRLKLLVVAGTLMIAGAVCYFVAIIAGWLPQPPTSDVSGLRPIASVAVAGCLLAAVGCFFIEREQEP